MLHWQYVMAVQSPQFWYIRNRPASQILSMWWKVYLVSTSYYRVKRTNSITRLSIIISMKSFFWTTLYFLHSYFYESPIVTVQIHVTCFALFCNFFVDFFFFAFSLFNFWFHRYDKTVFFFIAWQIVQDFGNTLFLSLWKLVSFKLSWLRLFNRIFAVIFLSFSSLTSFLGFEAHSSANIIIPLSFFCGHCRGFSTLLNFQLFTRSLSGFRF